MALFLLSQVFLIVSHGPLVYTLAAVILKSDLNMIQIGVRKVIETFSDISSNKSIEFSQPKETLEKSLENLSESLTISESLNDDDNNVEFTSETGETIDEKVHDLSKPSTSRVHVLPCDTSIKSSEQLDMNIPTEELENIKHLNVTDEEKERLALESPLTQSQIQHNALELLSNKPFLETILNSLFCTENDYAALFGLCLLYALANNQVMDK